MAWFVVYSTATGALVAAGGSVATQLPAGTAVKEFPAGPAPGFGQWDPVAKVYVAEAAPPPRLSVLSRIMAHPFIVALSAQQQSRVRQALLETVPEIDDL